MTEKELRKLNRYQLLELLVVQTKRADELQKKLDELEERTAEQHIHLSKLGSIAEASLQLSGVFDAAQKAAGLYLDAARKQAGEIVEDARLQAAGIVRDAEMKARYQSILLEDGVEK
ncbi:MAG: DNA repair protein [Oscillibacter sp.]|nr:DNA repair protein [Oscillibacter sp.]